MGLDQQVTELRRLGFSIASSTEDEVTAVLSKWYWDCSATHVTVCVFLRTAHVLTAERISADLASLWDRARGLEPSHIPLGLQHGRAILALYVADRVEDDARDLCLEPQATRFSQFCFPGALDLATGEAYFLRATPYRGGIYFIKLRHIAGRLLEPEYEPEQEPVSLSGLLLTIVLASLFLVPLALMLYVGFFTE